MAPAAALFWASVFGFAAMRPDYSHVTKAVSELGVWGAPNMWAFNILGYMTPGLLLAASGWMIGRGVRSGAFILPALLALSPLGLTAAGIFPGDMTNRESVTTLAHLAGSFSSLLLWLVALIWLVIVGRKAQRALWLTSLIALVLTMGAFALYGGSPPGLVQRITFAIYFAWFLAAALTLNRTAA